MKAGAATMSSALRSSARISPGPQPAARERVLAPLLVHVDGARLGHVSEIADGELPHTLARPGLVGGRGAAAGVVQTA